MRIVAIPGEHDRVWINSVELTPQASLKIKSHSPTGFSWGYGGSGPAQLALAILNERYGEKIAVQYYQEFKATVVATWPFEEKIHRDVDVDAWIATRMYPVGARVRLARPVERYPHFSAAAGMEGVVVSSDEEMICVRMNEHLPGAEEWQNEIHWYLPNDDGDGIIDDLEEAEHDLR